MLEAREPLRRGRGGARHARSRSTRGRNGEARSADPARRRPTRGAARRLRAIAERRRPSRGPGRGVHRHQARGRHRRRAPARRRRCRPTSAAHWAAPWILRVTQAGRHGRAARTTRSSRRPPSAGAIWRRSPRQLARARRRGAARPIWRAGKPRARAFRRSRRRPTSSIRRSPLAVASGAMTRRRRRPVLSRPVRRPAPSWSPLVARVEPARGRSDDALDRRMSRLHRGQPVDVAAPAARAGLRALHAVRPAGLGAGRPSSSPA